MQPAPPMLVPTSRSTTDASELPRSASTSWVKTACTMPRIPPPSYTIATATDEASLSTSCRDEGLIRRRKPTVAATFDGAFDLLGDAVRIVLHLLCHQRLDRVDDGCIGAVHLDLLRRYERAVKCSECVPTSTHPWQGSLTCVPVRSRLIRRYVAPIAAARFAALPAITSLEISCCASPKATFALALQRPAKRSGSAILSIHWPEPMLTTTSGRTAAAGTLYASIAGGDDGGAGGATDSSS
eukprot:5841450-Prymnesium_polylepis.2